MIGLPRSFYQSRRLDSLVENKTSYTGENASLHVFETHTEAQKVMLQFNLPVIASMFEGRKIMHLKDLDSFDFPPGESIIIPPNEPLCIDFPGATMDNPTRCLAMAVSESKISEVLDFMNENMPKAEGVDWSSIDYNFHFSNDEGIFQMIQRLIYLFTEDHQSRDMFVDFTLRELIVRILQTNNKKVYTDAGSDLESSNRIAMVVHYVRNNLDKSLSIDDLSRRAYMSESNFYRVFKNELGVSPIDFINGERIKKAITMLQDPRNKIKDIYMACGFESRSYFNRVFKTKQNISPREFIARNDKDTIQNFVY